MESEFRKGIEVVNTGIIRNKEGKILLVYSKRWDAWIFPGGHIEPGETIAQSIERECEEETGLRVKLVKVINQGELIDRNNFSEPIHLLYWHGVLDIVDEDKNGCKLDKSEHSDFCWITPRESLELKLSGNIPDLIKKYIKEYNL